MRFMRKLDDGECTTAGRVRNAVGRSKVSTDDMEAAIAHLVEKGQIRSETGKGKNGRIFTYLYTVK